MVKAEGQAEDVDGKEPCHDAGKDTEEDGLEFSSNSAFTVSMATVGTMAESSYFGCVSEKAAAGRSDMWASMS